MDPLPPLPAPAPADVGADGTPTSPPITISWPGGVLSQAQDDFVFRLAAASASTQPLTTVPRPTAAGYGIAFFWQLGVLQHLEAAYDLSGVSLVGSSAGAMLSVLAACNVEPQVRVVVAVQHQHTRNHPHHTHTHRLPWTWPTHCAWSTRCSSAPWAFWGCGAVLCVRGCRRCCRQTLRRCAAGA
jgi:hypothetical protein